MSNVTIANKSSSNHTTDLTDSKLLTDEELLKTVMQMFQLELLEHEFTQNEMKVTLFETSNIDQGYNLNHQSKNYDLAFPTNYLIYRTN